LEDEHRFFGVDAFESVDGFGADFGLDDPLF